MSEGDSYKIYTHLQPSHLLTFAGDLAFLGDFGFPPAFFGDFGFLATPPAFVALAFLGDLAFLAAAPPDFLAAFGFEAFLVGEDFAFFGVAAAAAADGLAPAAAAGAGEPPTAAAVAFLAGDCKLTNDS